MKINDDNFILQLKSGDERALQYVIDKYGGLVKSIIRKHLYSEAQEMFFDECIDDVFLAIWNNIDCFNPDKSSIKNWIAGIARFKAIDYGRKYSAIRKHEIESDLEATYIDCRIETLENEELSQQMNSLIVSLSKQEQELFINIYIEEISVSDISNEMGMKKENIYNRLSRIRKKLRKQHQLNEGRKNQ